MKKQAAINKATAVIAVAEWDKTALNNPHRIIIILDASNIPLEDNPSITKKTMQYIRKNALPLSMTIKNRGFSAFVYRSAGIPEGKQRMESRLIIIRIPRSLLMILRIRTLLYRNPSTSRDTYAVIETASIRTRNRLP